MQPIFKTIFGVILAMTIQTSGAQEFIVGPTDDAHFFFHNSKTENYGSEPLLRARFNTYGEFRTDIALRFDISDCTIELPYDKVYLKLYGSDDGVVCPVRVLKFEHTYANINWTESSINGATRPGTNYLTDSIAQLNFEGDYDEKYHQWDITEWVNQEKTAERNIINLHVRQMNVSGSAFNDPMFFHSKENESGKKPLLVIQRVQSGLKEVNELSDWAYISNGKILFKDAELYNSDIYIYNLNGMLIRVIDKDVSEKSIDELKGLNIVKVGNKVIKLFM